jgi:hypothetical protein
MGTSRLNARLKRFAILFCSSRDDLYNLYAKGICSTLSLDSRPTYFYARVGACVLLTTGDHASPYVASPPERERCMRHGKILPDVR